MIEPPPHTWNSLFHRQVGAFEIDREHPIPLGFRDLDYPADFGDAYIVVEHVDAAIGGDAGLNHCLDISGLTDVGAVCHRLTTLAPDDPSCLLCRRQVNIGAEYPRTFSCKGDRRSLAIAPTWPYRAGTDDERNLSLESVDHVSCSCDRSRRVRAARS